MLDPRESKIGKMTRLKDTLRRFEPKEREKCVDEALEEIKDEERRSRYETEFESLTTEEMARILKQRRRVKVAA